MMILEPNIVWDHTKGYVAALGKDIESQYCPADFFDGWHKAGRLVGGAGVWAWVQGVRGGCVCG